MTDPVAPIVEAVTDTVGPVVAATQPIVGVYTPSSRDDLGRPSPRPPRSSAGEPLPRRRSATEGPATRSAIPVTDQSRPAPVSCAGHAVAIVTPCTASTTLQAPRQRLGRKTALRGPVRASVALEQVRPALTGSYALARWRPQTTGRRPGFTAPDKNPGSPGAPSGGGALSVPGGRSSSALYALLLAFAALALLRFDRLQLRPVQWRCAAFVALLERPG